MRSGAPVRGHSRAIHSGLSTSIHSPVTPTLMFSPTLQWYSKPGGGEKLKEKVKRDIKRIDSADIE